ncbi:MAG: hypothetical protein R2800_03255 [Flavipsychrobacter sp.]
MDYESLSPTIEKIFLNKDYALSLSEIAVSIIDKASTTEISQEGADFAIEYKILRDNGGLEFTSPVFTNILYIVYYINKYSLVYESAEDWVDFISSSTPKTLPRHVAYQYSEFALVVINRFYCKSVVDYISNEEIKLPLKYRALFTTFIFLDTDIDTLVNFLFKITKEIKAEGNYFSLNNTVRFFAKQNIDFGKKIILNSKPYAEKLELFCPYAYLGLTQSLGVEASFYILKELLESSDILHQTVGLSCLSMLHGNNDTPEDIEHLLMPTLDQLELKGNDRINRGLIFVYGLLIEKLSQARPKLERFANSVLGKDAVWALSKVMLLKHEEEYMSEWYKVSFKSLTNLSNQHVDTYRNLNGIFHFIIKDREDEVFHFFELFIEEKENDLDNLEGFKMFFEEIYETNIEIIEKWITLWFNKDNSRFHVASMRVIGFNSLSRQTSISLHLPTLNSLSPSDIEFVLFKVVGFLYSKEQLENLLYSSLMYEGDCVYILKLVKLLFTDYIIYNYRGSIQFLKDKLQTANTVQKELIQHVIEFYEQVYNIEFDKPKEFSHSPERLKLLFEQENKRFKLDDDSIFKQPSTLDLFKKVSVKNGNHMFVRNEEMFDIKRQYSNKSTLGSISASFELPIGEYIDPVNQEYKRYIWRTFKRRAVK